MVQPAFHPARLPGYARATTAEITMVTGSWRDGQTIDVMIESDDDYGEGCGSDRVCRGAVTVDAPRDARRRISCRRKHDNAHANANATSAGPAPSSLQPPPGPVTGPTPPRDRGGSWLTAFGAVATTPPTLVADGTVPGPRPDGGADRGLHSDQKRLVLSSAHRSANREGEQSNHQHLPDPVPTPTQPASGVSKRARYAAATSSTRTNTNTI